MTHGPWTVDTSVPRAASSLIHVFSSYSQGPGYIRSKTLKLTNKYTPVIRDKYTPVIRDKYTPVIKYNVIKYTPVIRDYTPAIREDAPVIRD